MLPNVCDHAQLKAKEINEACIHIYRIPKIVLYIIILKGLFTLHLEKSIIFS